MKKETEMLFNGITNIDDDLIESAQIRHESARRPIRFMPWAAGAAAVCVCAAAVGVFMLNSGTPEIDVEKTPVTESSTIGTETDAPHTGTSTSALSDFHPLTVTEPAETSISEELPTVTADTASESVPPETTPAENTTTVTATAGSSAPATETLTQPTETTSKTSDTTTSEATTSENTTVSVTETTAVTERNIPQTSVNDLTYLSAPDDDAAVLSEPSYPYFPPYPDESVYTNDDEYEEVWSEWATVKNTLRKQPAGYKNGTEPFFRNSIRTFLGTAENENKVYSPLSLFMALGMSAEISGGYTRQQFLDVLGQDSIEDLRSHAKSIWEANYSDDGAAKCILASSVWLSNGIDYAAETVGSISGNYYSSVYSGIPGTEEYDKLLRDWLNKQTDGLLEEYASDVQLDPATVIALASTVNYSGKWRDKFNKEQTKKRSFCTPDGYIGCNFMNTERDMFVYGGEHFTAISMELEENGYMRLILPDDGYTPESLLNDEDAISFVTAERLDTITQQKFMTVALSVPKFDVSQRFDLTDGMKKLGITDAFDASVSDFEPLTDTDIDLSIGSASQAARVMIDEDGCKAAAFTIISYDGALDFEELDRIELVFDKPFIFEIMSETGLPLFVGIVNNPAQ